MKMYRTNAHDLEIQEREIKKETERYVFFEGENRVLSETKTGPYQKWHYSRRAALEWLHKQAIGKAVEGQRLLNEAAYEIKHVQIELKHLND